MIFSLNYIIEDKDKVADGRVDLIEHDLYKAGCWFIKK